MLAALDQKKWKQRCHDFGWQKENHEGWENEKLKLRRRPSFYSQLYELKEGTFRRATFQLSTRKEPLYSKF
jgi:hypothetical protein